MKIVFTAGEAARICGLSHGTILRCMDTGRLRCYRVPGSTHRRVTRKALEEFIGEHGLPAIDLDGARPRVLIAVTSSEAVRELSEALAPGASFEVEVARGPFEAGRAIVRSRPNVVLMDLEEEGQDFQPVVDMVRDLAARSRPVIIRVGYRAGNAPPPYTVFLPLVQPDAFRAWLLDRSQRRQIRRKSKDA